VLHGWGWGLCRGVLAIEGVAKWAAGGGGLVMMKLNCPGCTRRAVGGYRKRHKSSMERYP